MTLRTLWLGSTALAVTIGIPSVCVLGASGAAHAAGFALKEQSAEAQGASYAGAAARADDPSTLFFNPAGITKLPGYQVSTSLSGIIPNGTLASGSATAASYLGPLAGRSYGGITGTNSGVNAAVPSFYATAQVADDWHVGLSVTSPFGLATKYPTNSIARYYALTTQLKTVNIAPAVAWQALPNLSVGAALNVEYADAHLSQAIDFGGLGFAASHGALARYGFLPGSMDGIGTVKGNDTSVGFQLGLLYEPMPGTRVGLAYRSAMWHQLSGSIEYQGVPTLLSGAVHNQSITAKLPEPQSGSLSVAQDWNKFTFLADVTVTGWSVFKSLQTYGGPTLLQSTDENFRNTIAVGLGADYRLNDQVTLRGGVMYDQTPVRNASRTPRIADNDRYWLSIGATYRPIPNLALSTAYSHLFANNASVNLYDAGPGTPNFGKGNLNASYNLSVDIVSVQAAYKF